MKTVLIALIIACLLTVAFFGFGFHTYFMNQVVNDELVLTPIELPSEEGTSQGAETVMKEPMQIGGLAGELQRIDALHTGEGVVEWLEYDNGAQYIRFNDVDIVNGPDLYVYVSDQAVPGNTIASLGAYTDLGRLKGNQGTMIYELPEINHDIASIVVWCKRFGVLFTYATLTP